MTSKMENKLNSFFNLSCDVNDVISAISFIPMFKLRWTCDHLDESIKKIYILIQNLCINIILNNSEKLKCSSIISK